MPASPFKFPFLPSSQGPPGEMLATSRYECCPRCGWAVAQCEEIFDRGKCDPNRCDWFNPFYFCTGLGESIPCSKIYTEDGCTDEAQRPGECTWHQDIKLCEAAGVQPACDVYTNADVCKPHSDRCSWHPDVHMCNEKDEKIPCRRIVDKKDCDSVKGCGFDEHANVCYDSETHAG